MQRRYSKATKERAEIAERCFYCGRIMKERGHYKKSIDHITPIAEGGSNQSANLVICCNDCNVFKGKLTFEEVFAKIENRLRFCEDEKERQRLLKRKEGFLVAYRKLRHRESLISEDASRT